MTADDPIRARLSQMEGNDWGPGQFEMLSALRAVLDECDRWHASVHTFVTPGGRGLTTPGPVHHVNDGGGYEFGYTTEADLIAMGCTRLREGHATKIEKAIATALGLDA